MSTPAPVCDQLAQDVKLGQYSQFTVEQPRCRGRVQIGRPLFFGKNSSGKRPLFVALDYEQYNIAKTGMFIASGTAIALGVALIVSVMGKRRSL